MQVSDELVVAERQKQQLQAAVAALEQQIRELEPIVAAKRQALQAERDKVAAELAALQLQEQELDTLVEDSEAESSPRGAAPDTPHQVGHVCRFVAMSVHVAAPMPSCFAVVRCSVDAGHWGVTQHRACLQTLPCPRAGWSSEQL